jgi:hypothetical protein
LSGVAINRREAGQNVLIEMATSLQIRDCGDSLLVTSTPERSVINGIVSALVALAFVAIAFRHFLTMPLLVTCAVLAGIVSLLLGMRGQKGELRVTQTEIKSRGRFGDNFRSSRKVNPKDIRWMEYQEDATGPETSHHPGGLYAVFERHSVCVLAYIGEQQTVEVIEAIYKKFPDFKDCWSRRSAFGVHFASLGLHE